MQNLHALIDALSPRRREILALVARGLTNDDIGSALGISPGTVRTHVSALLEALELSNRTELAAAHVAWEGQGTRLDEVLARPAVAVLPLVPLDGSASLATIAAGMSHDLTALCAQWCWFPVIAHASMLEARALGRTASEIGRAVGARFIVHGTLRQGDAGYRLAVEVADCDDDRCLWTMKRDFERAALFEVQDLVCAEVVASAYPMLVTTVVERAAARRSDLSAWELAHGAMALHGMREARATLDARRQFEAALARDATLALAHYGLGLCAYDEILNQWSDANDARARLAAAAERCIALAPHGAEGFYLLGRYHQTRGDHASALTSLNAAIAKNPSFAAAHGLLAQVLHFAGRTDEALVMMQHAQRLGPRAFVAGLATLRFARREYAEALARAEEAIAIAPRYTYARALAAAAAFWLGDRSRAVDHARALATYPAFAPRGFRATFGPGVGARRAARARVRRAAAVTACRERAVRRGRDAI